MSSAGTLVYKETFLIIFESYSVQDGLTNPIYEFVPSDYSFVERPERIDKPRNFQLALRLKPGWKNWAKVCLQG